MLLALKIVSQVISLALAGLINLLDYKYKDGRTNLYKRLRISLLILSIGFLISSLAITIVDDINNNQKERELNGQLKKVQEQNDGLQKGIAVLSDKSSDMLVEQRNNFLSVLDDQRKLEDRQRDLGMTTTNNIKRATSLLNSGIKETIFK